MSATVQAIIAPHLNGNWLTPAQIAKAYNRSRFTVYRWCKDSTLIAFGFKVHQDSSRRWWILPPADPSSAPNLPIEAT
jgi:hypothetical protein